MCNQSQGYYGSNNTLSPAAQAIWDAYELVDCDEFKIDPRQAGLAAALQAAADQIENLYCDGDLEDSPGIVFALRQLMIIAAELKAT
jgi:hypothetical protein